MSGNNGKMLKVVGASWVRTRISTYILVGAALLAVGSLFLSEMERTTYDGTYCATVYWFQQSGFHVEYWGQQNDLQAIPKGVARTCYKDTTHENGWSKLEIETQPNYPDWIQAFGAGILEGDLTWQSIHNHWKITIQSYCEKNEISQSFCAWLRDVIDANYENIKNLADSKENTDQYWHQINLFYNQLEGIEFGWRQGARRLGNDFEIGMTDFVLINALNDIHDLRLYWENFIYQTNGNQTHLIDDNDDDDNDNGGIKSSILIKFLLENKLSAAEPPVIKKVLIGHSSDNSQSSLLRIFKKYKFHYHKNNKDHKSGEVTGIDMIFTGYPGCIASTDDFYIIRGKNSKLTIGGTRIKNQNYDLMKNIEIDNSVLIAARVMAANRLAHNGYTWSNLMTKNTGFGTKQWLVIDVKQLQTREENGSTSDNVTSSAVKQHQKDVLWIVDQLPGRLQGEDITENVCFNAGYWFSNGLPYIKEIFNASNIITADKNHQNNDFEMKFINKLIDNATDLDAMGAILRTKSYFGNLTGIKNLSTSMFSNIDVKLYSETNHGQMEFHALVGPMYYEKQFQTMFTKVKDMINMKAVTDGNEMLVRSSVNNVIHQRDKTKTTSIPNGNKFLAQSNDNNNNNNNVENMFNLDHISPKWAWKHDNM